MWSYSANPDALYPRRLTSALKLLLFGVTLTEIDERQRRCLVQRTINTTANNCNANYLGFSRFQHGPVVNKFYCPASYVYYVWTCLSLSLGSTVARDILRGSQLSGGRHLTRCGHSGNTGDLLLLWWSPKNNAEWIDPLVLGGCQLNAIDVDQRLGATFIEQRLAGDATIIWSRE